MKKYVPNNTTNLPTAAIGLKHIARTAQHRTEREREAMLFIYNYSRLRNISLERVASEINTRPEDLRVFLLADDAPHTLGQHCCLAAERVHREFVRTLAAPVPTSVYTKITAATRHALKCQCPVEVIGKTRMGKTYAAWHHYLLNLGRSLWVSCPSNESLSSFYYEIGTACGVPYHKNKNMGIARNDIKSVFRSGIVKLLFIDEAHFLFPKNPTKKNEKPARLEFIREIFDSRIQIDGTCSQGVVLLATPQYSSLLESMEDAEHWATGQWIGRAVPFRCPDALSVSDIAALADRYAPAAAEDARALLITATMGSKGYAGYLANIVALAKALRFDGAASPAGDAAPLIRSDIARAIEQALTAKQAAELAALKQTFTPKHSTESK